MIALLAAAALAAPIPTPVRMATVSAEQIRGKFPSKQAMREALCKEALSLVGTPYVFGDDGKRGFDCSSLVQAVFARSGVALPRVSVDQWFAGRPANPLEPRKGDLVFFATRGPAPSHVGLYLGDGRFVHAPGEGKNVRVTQMSARYYRQRYTGAVDLVGDE